VCGRLGEQGRDLVPVPLPVVADDEGDCAVLERRDRARPWLGNVRRVSAAMRGSPPRAVVSPRAAASVGLSRSAPLSRSNPRSNPPTAKICAYSSRLAPESAGRRRSEHGRGGPGKKAPATQGPPPPQEPSSPPAPDPAPGHSGHRHYCVPLGALYEHFTIRCFCGVSWVVSVACGGVWVPGGGVVVSMRWAACSRVAVWGGLRGLVGAGPLPPVSAGGMRSGYAGV
jgi:hypothetical protein